MRILKTASFVVLILSTAGVSYAATGAPSDMIGPGRIISAREANTRDSLDRYKAGLRLNPVDKNTLFNMGTVYLKINKPEEAALAFEALVAMDNRDAEAYNLLGLAYRGCGRTDEAIKAWERSLSIDPGQTLPKKFIDEARAF